MKIPLSPLPIPLMSSFFQDVSVVLPFVVVVVVVVVAVVVGRFFGHSSTHLKVASS